MKKGIIILTTCIVIIGIIILVYCGVTHYIAGKNHRILLDVVKNNSKLINENNEEILFKDYRIPGSNITEADQYTFVDMDKDGIDELVARTTSDYGAYIILHYNKKGDGKIYGYLVGIRTLEKIKADGSFLGSSSTDYSEYLTMTFDKNKNNIKAEAIYDGQNGTYIIDNKIVTKQEVDDFINKWNSKQDVQWINSK